MTSAWIYMSRIGYERLIHSQSAVKFFEANSKLLRQSNILSHALSHPIRCCFAATSPLSVTTLL